MAKSFNRYHWNPIRQDYFSQPQVQLQSVKPKAINIPVQFIGTDRNSMPAQATPPAAALEGPSEEARVSAVVTIQRAVRGFLVRKNASVVRQVAAELDEIERKFQQEGGKVCLDARERLRVNEALMALLLRLDSVRGVRDFRKKVIRRVITLQETIDSFPETIDGNTCTIDTGHNMEDSSNEAADESTIDNEKEANQTVDPEGETNRAETELKMEIPTAVESPNKKCDLIDAGDGTISTSGIADSIREAAEESSIYYEDQTLDLEEGTNEATTEMEMKIQEVNESLKRENNVIGFEVGRNELTSPVADEIPKGDDLDESQRSSLMVESPTGEKGEEGIVMRELMETMTAENKKLKEMVDLLCLTSAEQCRLIEDLADRVEHLERFVNRMDRRRKRRGSACSAISSAK